MKNETQIKRKLRKQGQRILSWFLSFTMVLSAMTASVPPLQVAAAGYEAEAEETVSSETAVGVEETASDDAAVAEEGEETVSDDEAVAEEEAVSGDEAQAEETVSDEAAADDVTAPVAFEEPEPAIYKNGGTEAVSYIYREWTENGLISENRTAENCIPVTSNMSSWESGWYVVNSDIVYSRRVSVSGSVNLILSDGMRLDVVKGIEVSKGNKLTIYAQGEEGYLDVRRDTVGAGIEAEGTVIINGGKVTATGNNGAGIGGGQTGEAGTVIINGGKVIATGNIGAGIGSGGIGDAGTVIINGGNVTATGNNGAGIGGGNGGAGGTVSINGGMVTATGNNGAGIGGGNSGAGGTVTINGGIVTATGDNGGAGIGGGYRGVGGTITINGGNVTATSRDGGAGIGGGQAGVGGSITLGYSVATDSISANSYSATGGIKVADGKCLSDGTNAYYGTLTNEQVDAIAGKTLVPAYRVNIGTVSNGTVSASPTFFVAKDYADANKTVTLTVSPDPDYTIGSVSYNDGAYHTIEPDNDGKYSFTMPAYNVIISATFPKSLSCNDITIESIADQTYTGSAITPAVTVKDGDTTLAQENDYKVSYSNNTNAASKNAAAAPTVTITGRGNYGGTRIVSFNIIQKAIIITANDQSVELGAAIATSTNNVSIPDGALASGHTLSGITVSTNNLRDHIGEFAGAIVPSAAKIMSGTNDVTSNYDITYVNGKLTVTKIKARVTTDPEVKTGLVYNGEVHDLITAGAADTGMEYALSDNAATAPTSGYSETVPQETNAKTYYVWYRAKEDADHEAGDAAVLTVEIAKADPFIATRPTASPISYGQTLANSNLTNGVAKLGETPVAGTFTWSNPTIAPVVADSNNTEYTVIFTPTDSTNINEASCELTLTVNKADIPAEKITPPTANSLTYTGSAQELINPGAVSDGLGTMKYAFAKVLDTDNPPAAPTEEAAYNSSVPTAIKGGNYYVWYMVKGDANHKDKTPASVKVTISKEHSKSEEMKTIEVQTGSNVSVSVNLKAYLGENAIVSPGEITNEENRTGTLTFSDIQMGSDHYTLSFKVTSEAGGTGRIILKAQTENHQTYWLTIPVEAKAITTEVKLEEVPGVDSAVEGVEVSGLDAYTDSQSGTTVKVEMDVKTESESSVDTAVVEKITESVAQVFSGVEAQSIKKEYLDISVTKSVNGGSAQTVEDVGRVLELAIRYDLNGKFNPVVIREHNRAVKAFKALETKPAAQTDFRDATSYVDKTKGIIYIYTEFFSTYSIAYATTDSYTVKFDANGGSAVDDRIVAQGAAIGTLPSASRSGYSFDGWWTEASGGDRITAATVIEEDITFFAHWKSNYIPPAPTYYTISFDMGGHGTAVTSQSIISGGKVSKPSPDPAAEGFTFDGWYKDAAYMNAYNFDQNVYSSFTLYAKWVKNAEEDEHYTVSFNMMNHGTSISAQTVSAGQLLEIPMDPVDEAYVFGGWFTEEECINGYNFETPVTADFWLYAKWTVKKYTVSFNMNGKTVEEAPATQNIEHGKTAARPEKDPETEGFVFTNWYTEAACENVYDFATPVTWDVELYAGWEEAPEIVIEDDGIWNLYEDASEHTFKVSGISVSSAIANGNAKSKAYFESSISGNTITVNVTGDRKKATANSTLTFDLGADGVIEYQLPVSYVKPEFKLSSNNGMIKKGTETVLHTMLLYKNADGNYEPYDMTDVTVSGNGLGSVAKAADGSIEIKTSAAGKGSITVLKESWDGKTAVSLAYSVKSSNNDVLTVDLGGLKNVVVNSNAKDQVFTFDVTLNGTVPEEGTVEIVDKKKTGLASISENGKLVIAYKEDVKNGTYTITLKTDSAKANVKIKVSGKALDKAVTAKIQTKLDVVTKQSMVVVPKLQDINGTITAVSVSADGFTAKMNAAGNIVIDYSGDKYDAKNLNIGNLTLSLTISGVEKPVILTLKNVKAKKTMPKVKAGTVTIPADAVAADGKVIGAANIISMYKTGSGMYKAIKPVKSEIVGTPKGVEAKVNDNDLSEIDIYSLSKKSASFKVKLTYTGGVTKTVTVKVKKK